MASSASSISSLSSVRFSLHSTHLEIQKFFCLSKNLSLKEQAEGGEEYRLLSQLFDEGYTINPFYHVRGDKGESWPELCKRGIDFQCISVSSLLGYLKNLSKDLESFASFRMSSLEEREIRDYLELGKNKENSCFSCLGKIEKSFSLLGTDFQTALGDSLFSQTKGEEGTTPSFSKMPTKSISSLSAPAIAFNSSVSKISAPVFQKLGEQPLSSQKID